MFKYLTRTLKLGLTTLTILTAGAGAAFAQPAGFDTAIDPIDDCLNSGSRGPRYCTVQVVNCINNPFDSGCARTLGTKAHTVAKVRYCGEASHRAEPACASTVAGVNAAHWANPENWEDNPSKVPTNVPNPIANGQSHFLKGTATGLNTGDDIEREKGALYFDIATFNGRALDGDATDGVAFFHGWDTSTSNRGTSNRRFYAGILSGTDLGAPVDNPAGTTASWVGRFQAVNHITNQDFVLEVTFGSDIEGKAGSIEAFVYRQGTSQSYAFYRHFYLKGDFDNSGLITGTVNLGNFTVNGRENTTGFRRPGILTGLIGQEGAVGAFHSNGSWYAGGFIARPPSDLDTAFLNTTCSADPFTNKHQNLCYLEYADDRVTRINDCIIGDNASGAECRTAREAHSCLTNPFASNCVTDFAEHYEAARAKRAEFCVGDLTNSLCTGTGATDAICTYAPFASICFSGSSYDTARANKYTFCRAGSNVTDPSCTGVTASPNALTWEDNFVTTETPNGLSSAPDTTNRRNQFLKGTTNGVNKGDIVVPFSHSEVSLNLNTAEFNDTPLGGDAADGVAFIAGRVYSQSTFYYYAGIFSGTDLGAPITDTSGTARWVGRFQAIGWPANTEFILEIDFNGTGDKAGYIKAFVHQRSNYHFYLDGSYDAHGVITGTVDYGTFTNNERGSSTRDPNGTLTGLIGKDGAVGAFIRNPVGYSYSGGFVARPANTADKRYLNTTCTDDPFGYLCYLEKDKQAAKIIECTEGSNASGAGCTRAVQLNDCLTNPFASNCVTDFAKHYEVARTNRTKFCVGDLTNSLCTGTGATAAICTYAPFASICFSGSSYDTARANKYSFCRTGSNVTDPSCTGVTDNPNALAWADSFVTTQNPNGLSSAPDTTNRRNQFLKATASGVNKGDITVNSSGSLNLNTATFNGRALGGDTADGVAYFRGQVTSYGIQYFYSGIFSGTDLGAPITQTSGTASWVGRFQAFYNSANRDFVLEVTFGGSGDKAGSIEAFVHNSGLYFYHINGTFDRNGLIEGTTNLADFTNNDRDSRKTSANTSAGVLTGLIGQEGAVGAFHHSDGNLYYYAGGFVARPANTADNSYLNTTCTANPFHELCYLEKGKQATKIIECTEGSNASTTGCARAVQLNPCINNPFASNCVSDFAKHYVTARTNRINFCINNLTNTLCTNSSAISAVCTYAPFTEICFNGNSYKSARASKINFCHTNTTHLSCTGVTDNPNAVAWADSLAKQDDPVILTSAPSTTNRGNQFLKGTTSGVNRGNITASSSGSLNLNTTTFNGTRLGGDATDGVAFFYGRVNGTGTRYYHSGIFSGTDLGAPITDLSGTASWVGRFRSLYHNINTDFVLEVDYTNRSVDAFVQYSGNLHFYLDGNYDDKGIITGDFNFSYFNNSNRKTKRSTYRTGVITGLIGQDGAVGAFHGDASNSFAGGFVARPANTADNRYLNTTCTNDPFGPFCYLEKDKQRAKIIECTEGRNASTTGCARAVQLNSCLTNPFASNCTTDFADYYEAAQKKRTKFCVGDLTNSLCTGDGATEAICTYAPFASICFSGSSHDTARANKYTFCSTGSNVTDPSCTGVMDNPNALAWAADSSVTVAASADTEIATKGNQFLKGGTTELSNIGVTDIISSSLNLATATFGDNPLGGQASDGVAFFRGTHSGGAKHYYAGILSGTDLGGPVTQTTGSANWKGSFQYVNAFDDIPNAVDLTLKVNFSSTIADVAGSISGNVPVPVFGMWAIAGTFNDKGIIDGTINWAFGEVGEMTGLIGRQGAVGAFYGADSPFTRNLSGGFVACPYDSVNNRCQR